MTPYDVVTIFERANREGCVDASLDEAYRGFAGWLSEGSNGRERMR